MRGAEDFWARALMLLHAKDLDVQTVQDTLNVLLKFEGDMNTGTRRAAELTHKALREGGGEAAAAN